MMMTLTIVLAEITIVLLVVVGVISVKTIKLRKRDRDAVKTLVISIKANQPARVEKLAGILKDNNQLSDDDALEKANQLIKRQNKFYRDAIDLYFTRNHEVLSKLDNRLEGLLDQYQGLLKVTAEDNTAVDSEAMEQLSKDIAALSKELEELRAENASLSTQLKAAEHELDQLGREYVSAFNKPKTDKAKQEGTEEPEDTEETESDDEVEVNDSETVSSEETQSTNVEAIADETPNPTDEAEQLVIDDAIEEPTQTESAPVGEQVNSKAGEDDAQPALDHDAVDIDDSDSENLFADLGLDELIGEKPGPQISAGKAADN